MLMNRIESALINSAPRRWLQRWYETPWLLHLGGRQPTRARTGAADDVDDAGARVRGCGCHSWRRRRRR